MASSHTDLYQYISANGVILPDTAQVLAEVQAEYKAIFGSNLILTPETPQGRLVEAEALLRTQFLGINAHNAMQFNPNFATGVYLDAIGALWGLTRKSASPLRISVDVFGAVNDTVSAGFRIATPSRLYFALEEDVNLGTSGSATGVFLCETPGDERPADLADISIDSADLAVDSIAYKGIYAYGQNAETDAEFRDRILIGIHTRGVGWCETMREAILAASGVRSCLVLENGYNTEFTRRDITLAPHSIFVCVDGLSSGNKTAVAEAVYKFKTAGCGYTSTGATETVTIQDATQSAVEVYITPASSVPVTVSATISRGRYTGALSQDAVRAALNAWSTDAELSAANTQVGGTMDVFDISQYLLSTFPGIRITSALITKGGGSGESSVQTISAHGDECLYIDAESSAITITA